MKTYCIGGDVHSEGTDLVVDCSGKIVGRYTVPTTIPALVAVLDKIPSPKAMVIEECPMAGWLFRNLRSHVDRFVICDPRRNRLITDDGEATDPVDAGKLAELLRGNHLREVHHPIELEQALLKEWVALYHDRVRQAVREICKLRARCRMHGVRPARGVRRDVKARAEWLRRLQPHGLAEQLKVLFDAMDSCARQVTRVRCKLGQLAGKHPIIRKWQGVPGMGLIRSITFLAYAETPWRFATCKKRWKYCGVGLIRSASGKDKKGKEKPGKLRLAWAINRRLKNVVMGATVTAIETGKNKFSDLYQKLIRKGVLPSNARHTVARKMIDTLFAMWKTNSDFKADLA